jgi:hypothetical protein
MCPLWLFFPEKIKYSHTGLKCFFLCNLCVLWCYFIPGKNIATKGTKDSNIFLSYVIYVSFVAILCFSV